MQRGILLGIATHTIDKGDAIEVSVTHEVQGVSEYEASNAIRAAEDILPGATVLAYKNDDGALEAFGSHLLIDTTIEKDGELRSDLEMLTRLGLFVQNHGNNYALYLGIKKITEITKEEDGWLWQAPRRSGKRAVIHDDLRELVVKYILPGLGYTPFNERQAKGFVNARR
ncbi:MAG: hypothetical protein OEX12_11645 [Gammaproteobacteria bacterium]|nr:hypothetical protein [Gammaproteobacteria bacterium]